MGGDITERIETLLGEVEELSHSAKDVPSALLMQALATIERARCILKTCARRIESAVIEEDSDPQPDVDGEVLERMYRVLGSGRLPSK
jgi:hypothetical protein